MIKLYDSNNTIHSYVLIFCKKKEQLDSNTLEQFKLFKQSLSKEELKEFRKIRKRFMESEWRKSNKESIKRSYDKQKEKYKAKNKIWRNNNPEKIKRHHDNWVAKNKEYHYSVIAKWKKDNKDKINKQAKRYRKNKQNTQKHREYMKQWRLKNKERINKQLVERSKERKQTDNLFAAKEKLRCAVYSAFSRIKKNKPSDTQSLLGCNWEQAKAHIENLWQEGMSWQNHGRGKGKWNIDHIRPVSSFKDNELHLMNLIENLQPLWFEDNMIKGNKFSCDRIRTDT